MDCSSFRPVSVRGPRRALVALLLSLASGCVSSKEELVSEFGINGTPAENIAVVWSSRLVTGIDPANNNTPMCGFAGRVFLFGHELHDNLLADGDLYVDLYATLPEQPQAPPVCLMNWIIKKDDLNRTNLRKDFCGNGYTLNLPWPNYRPDINQVRLSVRYQPAKGGVPLYRQDLMTLRQDPVAAPTCTARTETGNRQPILPPQTPPGLPAGPVQQMAAYPPAAPAQMPYLGPPQQPVRTLPAPYQGPLQQAGGFPAPGQPTAPIQQAVGPSQQFAPSFQAPQQFSAGAYQR
jgi:hypothetical protein